MEGGGGEAPASRRPPARPRLASPSPARPRAPPPRAPLTSSPPPPRARAPRPFPSASRAPASRPSVPSAFTLFLLPRAPFPPPSPLPLPASRPPCSPPLLSSAPPTLSAPGGALGGVGAAPRAQSGVRRPPGPAGGPSGEGSAGEFSLFRGRDRERRTVPLYSVALPSEKGMVSARVGGCSSSGATLEPLSSARFLGRFLCVSQFSARGSTELGLALPGPERDLEYFLPLCSQ